ncbi:MAG: hypothetical protein GX270_10165 [Clostridiaceae bacterium]|nr:hypothetical protein [Clostridiaceae bacterium]
MCNIPIEDKRNYIDWDSYMNSKGEEIKVKNNEPGIVWKDAVTDTWFYLSNEKYNEYINRIVENFGGGLDSHGKVSFEYKKICDFYDIKNFSKLKSLPWRYAEKEKKPAVVDVCRLFVLFAWLYGEVDKDSRINAYKSFFEGSFDNYPKAYNAVKALTSENSIKINQDKEIILIKGGAYKIKKYYLENSKIHDIRGASIIIKHLTEDLIPQEVFESYIEEAVIYSGGGNIFAVVDSDLKKVIEVIGKCEKIIDDYAITLENVFCYYKSSIYNLIENYRDEMKKFDIEIEQKKKLKIYNNIYTRSSLLNNSIKIGNEQIKIECREELTGDAESGACKRCNTKEALYKVDTPDGQECICGSCLHKLKIGRKCKSSFNKDLEDYINKANLQGISFSMPKEIEDIKDSKGYISVIYGDGNNFGKIVNSLENIYEMMYFSRMVYMTSFEATCKAILDSNYSLQNEKKNLKPFELIALGGDDIFLICPAENSMCFSKHLITEFNKKFREVIATDKENNKITLSIGIAVGKYNNPVRNLFEMAESKLLSAKRLERELASKGQNNGSVDIVVVKGTSYVDFISEQSMFPMDNDSFGEFLKLVNKMKSSEIKKSRIQNLVRAKQQMEEESEFQLYFLYNDCKQKDKNKLEKWMKENYFSKGIYRFEAGMMVKDISEIEGKSVRCNVWKDILDIWDFCKGGVSI